MKPSVLVVTSEWPSEENPNAAPAVQQQVDYLRRAGLRVDVSPFRGSASPARYAMARRRVAAAVAKLRPDLIHAHFGQSGLAALPSPVPLVVTFHGSDLEGVVGARGRYTLKGRLLQRVSRLVARRADEVIVISEALARHLPPKISYEVIPTGVDFGLFRPMVREHARQRLGLDPEQRLILFSGRPDVPVKRYSLAKRSVKELADPNIHLIVAEGIPLTEMPTLMNAADMLLVTSLHEGGPSTVKEALACNLPVVSVDVGDVSELISELEGCVLCRDDRPQTIGAAIGSVLRIGKPFNGRRAVQHLEASVVARHVASVYERVLQGAT